MKHSAWLLRKCEKKGVILKFGSFGFGGFSGLFGSCVKIFACVCWDCNRFLFCIGLNLGYSCMSLWLNE